MLPVVTIMRILRVDVSQLFFTSDSKQPVCRYLPIVIVKKWYVGISQTFLYLLGRDHLVLFRMLSTGSSAINKSIYDRKSTCFYTQFVHVPIFKGRYQARICETSVVDILRFHLSKDINERYLFRRNGRLGY